jgi:tetratricopeptide (TPR) repeat protein
LQQGSLSLNEISSILNQIASALDYAYETHNIVHRDIKPSNIFFEGGKRVALGDFGIAKDVSRNTQLTSLGEGVGTPDYMSPEQAMGDHLDRRSDVYSLGVVLFEMLTGTLPFKGDTPISVVMGHIQKPVPPVRTINPDIPNTVEQVVTRSLAKKKEERWASAGELAKALEAAVKGTPVDGATIAVSGNYMGSMRPSTLGMGAVMPPNPVVVTQELNLVSELEKQNRYQDAFDRLFTLQYQYPNESNITTRYRNYVTQGYVPSNQALTGSMSGVQSTAPGVATPTGTYTPSSSTYTHPGVASTTSGSGSIVVPEKKNSPLPFIIGGVVALAIVAVIVIVIVVGGGSKPNPTPASTVANTTTGVTATTTGSATTTAPVSTTAATTTISGADRAAALNKDGESLLEAGNLNGAVDKFKEAVRLSPGTALYHDNLAAAYNATKEYALAENEARLALSLDPTVARYHNNLGIAVAALGKYSDAERAYREAVRLKPSEPLYHRNLASALVELNRPTDAEESARRAIALYATDSSKEKDKNLGAAHNVLGDSLLDQDKFTEAEKSYRDAIKLVPDSALFQTNLSNALYLQNKYPEAEAESRKAISLDPAYPTAHNLLGLTLELQSKWSDALLSYQKAVELSPKTALYRRNLAGALIELRRYPEAEEQAKAAIDIDPNNTSNARAYNLWGIALYSQKKYDPAIAAYQKAIQLNGKVSVYYSNLGLCFEQMNQPLRAREAYQKALEVDANNKDAKDGLERLKNK